MADKALYILAGYDDETESHLFSFQNRLYRQGFTGTHTKNILQHITLASFPVEKEEELKQMLVDMSEDFSSFDITFNHVGIFGGERVLFIAPDTNLQLLKLKETFSDSYNWTPHTTVLIDTPDMIYKALPEVMKDFSAFKGKVSALHLYEFFPTRHILSVDLKK